MEWFETFSRIILLILTIVFLYSTISFTLLSFISGTCLIGYLMLYLFLKNLNKSQTKEDTSKNQNPYKNHRKIKTLNEDVDADFSDQLINFTTYDATDVTSLHHFDLIKNNSACIFAKTANIWGSCDWNDKLTLEENIFRMLPTLLKFTVNNIDGFVIELPNGISSNLEVFSESVRRVLKMISDNDPGGGKSMNKSYLDKPGWVFEFNKITLFVTTFAPFYLESNSRYSYGSQYGFILLQPEVSFAKHDLTPDTALTKWDNPQTIRDRIRIAFKEKGQEYTIPSTLNYPMINHIVKPLKEGDPVVTWWKNKTN